MKRYLSVPGLSLLLLAAACSDSDSNPASDGGARDGATPAGDGGGDTRDGAVSDAATPLDGTVPEADSGGGADAGVDSGPEPVTCNASAAPDVANLGLEAKVTGVTKLVYAAQPPGSSDWYLVQQTGQVLYRAAGSTVNAPFLDLSAELMVPNNNNDERGLLGIAFPADYAQSGLFYVMLTPAGGATANRDQVRQYQKSGSTVTLKETLVSLPVSESNHNGGTIAFGPDGMLYVGTGDGGGSCNSNQPDKPQDPSSLFGKILRLDPNNKAGEFAAAGNPFPENPKVWHIGLRNPFRFGFDRRTGDMLLGDVGQNGYEEIDFVKSGGSGLNFGWASYEGKMQTCPGRSARAGTLTEPIFVADQRMTGCTGQFCDWVSVIGGVVYRGSELPKLKGAYIFGDYQGARMVSLYQCESGTSPTVVIRKNRSASEPTTPYFAESGFADLTAIVEGSDGELYFVANKSTLYKVIAR